VYQPAYALRASARHPFAFAALQGKGWGGRRDLNPQQQAPQAWTLPLSYDHQPADKLGLLAASVKFATMWVVASFEFPPFENPFRLVFSTVLASGGAYEAKGRG